MSYPERDTFSGLGYPEIEPLPAPSENYLQALYLREEEVGA